jgi:hypothetical protein
LLPEIRRSTTLRFAACKRRPAVLALLCVLAWLGAQSVAGSAAAETTPETIRQTVEGVYASGRYQTELPQQQPQVEWEPLRIPDIVKELIRILFWMLLVVGGLLLLFYLISALPSLQQRLKRRAADRDSSSVGPMPKDADRERLDLALGEADRLARQGAYGEALHLLLLYCLNEMRRRFGLLLPPSLTSREILGLSVLPEVRRTGLSVIVSAVEVSHFGGRPVDESTYLSCRERCEDVVLGGAQA